ncbi:unnamed protein product [Mytilus coruscus]|uniref:Uncharacterized protein n=1 Tax=Mytilus coruscus TaxID=42192 RepID=A0A6J8BP94_MYTCO|nr:unnamed protein product [Mytilus coruscus]
MLYGFTKYCYPSSFEESWKKQLKTNLRFNWYNQSNTVENVTIPHSGIQENCVPVDINKGARSDDFNNIDIVSSSLQRQIIDGKDINIAALFIPNYECPQSHTVFADSIEVYDHNKYTVVHEGGHYWIFIKNVTAKDIGIPYACHCGFYYLDSILNNVSTLHSDDKDDDDKQKNFMVQTPEDKRDKGKTKDVSTIVGSCVGTLLGVLVVISIVYAVISRYKKEAGKCETIFSIHGLRQF